METSESISMFTTKLDYVLFYFLGIPHSRTSNIIFTMACEDCTLFGEFKFNLHSVIIFRCWMLYFIKSISKILAWIYILSLLFIGKKLVWIASFPSPPRSCIFVLHGTSITVNIKKVQVMLTVLTLYCNFNIVHYFKRSVI